MSRVYALLQPDESLLVARPRGSGWSVGSRLGGVEGRGRNLTVILSGLDVTGLMATIPARSENEARRAAPFAIEDDLAEAVEASHVALSDPNRADPTSARRLNAISARRLRDIIALLTERGLQEAEIVAAHSLLPEGNILYEAPGLVLGRLGERSFTLDAGLGQDVLISLCADHPEIAIYGQHVADALGRSANESGASSMEALLVQLATWADRDKRGIRLRQGAFEARRAIDLDGIDRWRFAGGLAAVAAIAWFGSVILETNAMNTRAQQLDTLAQEFARVGWPEHGGDVRQVLALGGGPDSARERPFPAVLDVSALLYDALSQVEGSELRTLRYDRVRRQLTASVAFESFADVDRLTTALNESGLSARSGDSRQSGNRVIGDLTLEQAL